MMRGFLTLVAVLAVFLLGGCGGSIGELKAEPAIRAFEPQAGTIQGKPFRFVSGATTIDRIRVQRLTNLADTKDPHAAVLIFGSFGDQETPLTVSPDFTASGDLVFLNRQGVAVKLFASDDSHYVPFGARTSATGSDNGANNYSSGVPASVVLVLPRGKAAELGIREGGKVELSPDPLAQVAKADPNGIQLYFRPRKLRKPESTLIPDPIRLSVPLEIRAEERARGILDGQDGILLMFPFEDTKWQNDGFWLKGKTGEYSVAFLRMQQGVGGHGPLPFVGSVVDVVEGITDSEGGDLGRNAWYPSSQRAQVNDEMPAYDLWGAGRISGPVNAVLVMRGKNAFSSKGIEEDMWVNGGPLAIRTGTGNHGDGLEPSNLSSLSLSVGGTTSGLNLLQRQEDIDAAVSGTLLFRDGHTTLLAWDDAARAEVRNFRSSPRNLAMLSHASGNKYTVSKIESVSGAMRTRTAISSAPSRFAVLIGQGQELSVGTELVLPWQVHNVRPLLGLGAFWKGRGTVKQATAAPKDSKQIKLELAQTEAEISRGLMFRKSLPENQGMLFLFKDAEPHSFWMKNCEIDIDVAFVNEDFSITVIHEMKKPEAGTREADLPRYSSRGRVLYAVEMEGGWFAKNGIAAGDRLWLPPGLRQRASK